MKTDRSSAPRSFVIAAPIAIALLGCYDALTVSSAHSFESPWTVVELFLIAVRIRIVLIVITLGIQALFTVGWARMGNRWWIGGIAGLACTFSSYAVAMEYPRFRTMLPLIACWTAIGLYLALTYVLMMRQTRTWIRAALVATLLLGAVIAAWGNRTELAYGYTELQRATSIMVYLLLHAGIVFLLSLWQAPRPQTVAWAAVVIGLAGAGSFATARSTMIDYETFTPLGRAMAATNHWDDECRSAPLALREGEALSVFAASSGMPVLPPSFHVTDFNVLLITIETTRFDESSLSGRAGATPNLARLVDAGAFALLDNMAPSSSTFMSMSSMFTQTYPSHAPITTEIPAWHGELRPEAQAVAESFRAAGYSTFAALHPYLPIVSRGLAQGFDDTWFGDLPKDTADERIADHAIERLDANANRRFFGWVFFISPHWPYAARKPNTNTARERYRQEVANADTQLGRVLDHLRTTHLLDRTIVIVTSDHGEEFLEHGQRYHKATVYQEVLHTPMVIWIPGVTGRPVTTLTSSTYLFPWLLLTGDGSLAASARRAIREDLAPMMKFVGGAAIAELVGYDRMKVALISQSRAFLINLLSGRTQAFDRNFDPLQQRNIATIPAIDRDLRKVLERYLAQRGCRARLHVTHDDFVADSTAE